MVRQNDISLTASIPRGALQRFEREARELAITDIPAAAQSALNGTAVDAVAHIERSIARNLHKPTQETRKAFIARRKRHSRVSSLDEVSAEIGLREPQARWMRFVLGDEDQVRRPGEVGIGKKRILIPIPENAKEAGIDIGLDRLDNVRPGTMRRLFDMTGAGGRLFWGRIREGGRLGLFARPDRVNGKNVGAPKMIVAAAEKTRHRPILQPLIERAAKRAWRNLSARFAEALRRRRPR